MRKKLPRNKCAECGVECTRTNQVYCCNKCQIVYQRKQKVFDGIASHCCLKNHLIENRGHRCEICGIETWMNQPAPLVMDHINGKSDDNSVANLRLVCGNCDMQLPTYKNKNRGNGRASRRQRYAAGMSY